MKKKDRKKLELWQGRLERNETAYAGQTDRMDSREALYLGDRSLRPLVKEDKTTTANHIRNLCAELVECQVDSNIPTPKVTAKRPGDEWKAKRIEDMLRSQLDRLPFEELNDRMERTVPIQGGGLFLLEWDNSQRTHRTVGELAVSVLHPKQVIPQDGVYTGVEDMDYILLKVPQTKGYIQRRYGVTVEDEREEEPEMKGSEGQSASEDMVTQYIAYYRNDQGGIGLYSWVGDTPLEDLEDYQARRLRWCRQCGAQEPLEAEPVSVPSLDGTLPGLPPMPQEETKWDRTEPETKPGRRRACPYCGSTAWTDSTEDYEELSYPVKRSDGTTVGGMVEEAVVSDTERDLMGLPVVHYTMVPTKVPYYKPDIYPLILQKNVSVYGRFLGDSDIDKITDQQNTTNRIETTIAEKLLAGGSYITLPDLASIQTGPGNMRVIRPGNAADKNLIGVYDLEGNIEQDLAYLAQVYEEARQVIGITDSYLGRKDTTATSGKAKEFSAAQAAGRMESKRVMKKAAYATLFEAMFKFMLAYADEPRPVLGTDLQGNTKYEEFNRWDFLEQDEAGDWYWNDDFLFSCDTSAPLANNREAMWQETRMNLQTGAFGDPKSLSTLILFWGKMEKLHYPGAAETKGYLEEEARKQQLAMGGGTIDPRGPMVPPLAPSGGLTRAPQGAHSQPEKSF